MTLGWILQIVFDAFLILVTTGLLVRTMKRPKEDPRLSRGLQLLQSKISVLEDLSDRTEVQVRQLNALLDQKVKSIDEKILAADKKLAGIDHSIEKSMEVAEIFQDRIPHKEIIERQSLMNYVKAARLAHSGLSVDQIAQQVNLPRSELEFIAKVNRERLLFAEDDLPAWVGNSGIPKTHEVRSEPTADQFVKAKLPEWKADSAPMARATLELPPNQVEPSKTISSEKQTFAGFSQPFAFIEKPGESLPELGRKFKEACADFDESQEERRRHSLATDLHKMSESFLEQAKASFRLQPFHPDTLLGKLEEKLHPTDENLAGRQKGEVGHQEISEVSEVHDNF